MFAYYERLAVARLFCTTSVSRDSPRVPGPDAIHEFRGTLLAAQRNARFSIGNRVSRCVPNAPIQWGKVATPGIGGPFVPLDKSEPSEEAPLVSRICRA